MSVRPPLTPEQEAVVTDPRERLFVRACPGSGKTRTVVERFLFRAGAITSRHGVAALSFSRRATKEIRQRCIAGGLERLLGFPHYVGTLDGFFFRYVFRPFEQARTKRRVQVVDSWDAIGAKVKVRGVQSGGVSLDAFPVVNGRPTFELARVRGNDFAIGKEIARDPGPWEASAARYLQHLNAKGIYSCDGVRTRVHGLLASGALVSVLLPALAARFAEVIVDEAQDCDEAQIGLLEALGTAGVRLVVVADPEQAIYEFRAARPDLLHALTAGMAVRELTGNQRSTPAICALANSMRASALPPMTAVGKHRDTRTPVYVIPYAGSSVDEAPALLTAAALGDGVALHELLLLAHRKSVAMKTAGLEELDGPGGGSAAQVARLADRLARGQLRGPDAEHAIRDVERLLLRRLALEPDGAAVADVCEKHRLEPRWLRGAAYSVLRAVGLALAGRDAATMAEATEFLRGALDRIAAPGEGPWPKSVKALVPLRTPEATITLRKRAGAGIQATLAHTIHSVKGSESAAALVVLSNARGANLGALLDAWETRAELEAKRVAYVAMTRAELVVGIAVPEAFRDRLVQILTAGNVPYRMAGDASRSGRG